MEHGIARLGRFGVRGRLQELSKMQKHPQRSSRLSLVLHKEIYAGLRYPWTSSTDQVRQGGRSPCIRRKRYRQWDYALPASAVSTPRKTGPTDVPPRSLQVMNPDRILGSGVEQNGVTGTGLPHGVLCSAGFSCWHTIYRTKSPPPTLEVGGGVGGGGRGGR